MSYSASESAALARAELKTILLERDALFPVRDEANTRRMHTAFDAYYAAISEIRAPGWCPEEDLAAQALSLQENLVVICGFMKSGTTLLVELLDGHPQLVVMPGDSRLLAASSAATEGPLGRYWTQRLINPKGQVPFWLYGEHDAPHVSFLCWLDHWLEVRGQTGRGPALAVVLAHFCANPRRPPRPQAWLEKTPGNEFYVDRILASFPRARFIHVFRDPRDNMASLEKLYRIREWHWSAAGQAARLDTSIRIGFHNRRRLGRARYHLCRYEDVLRHPATTLGRVAEFLGIDWVPELLTPTINSQLTKANSMYRNLQVSGPLRPSSTLHGRTLLMGADGDAALAETFQTAARLGYCYGSWTVQRARARHLLRVLRSKIARRVGTLFRGG